MKSGLLSSTIITAILLASCSGSDSNSSFSAGVTDVRVENSSINVGEFTVAAIDFTYSADGVFNDKRNVQLVVRLPSELSYAEGTAELDQAVGEDDKIGAQVTRCADGDTYLLFDMDRFDLDGAANPDGDSDARLTLTVQGVKAAPVVYLEAAARDEYTPFGCGQPFLVDEDAAISITR